MQRDLPIHEIRGIKFIVDVQRNELRELNHPTHAISFTDMIYEGSGYRFNVDFLSDSTQLKPFDGKPPEMVTIPQKSELDPNGVADLLHLPLEQVTGKSDFDVFVDQENYALRDAGILPVIDIAGHPIFVDLRLGVLRPKDDVMHTIQLNKLPINNEDEYEFFYKPRSRQIVHVSPKLTHLPKSVLLVQVPNDIVLDSYGVAQLYNMEIKNWLLKYPLQMKMTAKTTPLTKTPAKEMAKNNREQSLLPKREDKGQNRKGKHL